MCMHIGAQRNSALMQTISLLLSYSENQSEKSEQRDKVSDCHVGSAPSFRLTCRLTT